MFVFNRREDAVPSKHSRICSCHFESGHGLPDVYARNENMQFNFQSPEKKKRKRRQRHSAEGVQAEEHRLEVQVELQNEEIIEVLDEGESTVSEEIQNVTSSMAALNTVNTYLKFL